MVRDEKAAHPAGVGRGPVAATSPGFAATAPGLRRVGVFGRPSGLIQHWKEGFPREFALHGFVEGGKPGIVWFTTLLPTEEALGSSGGGRTPGGRRMLDAGLECMSDSRRPRNALPPGGHALHSIVTDVPDRWARASRRAWGDPEATSLACTRAEPSSFSRASRCCASCPRAHRASHGSDGPASRSGSGRSRPPRRSWEFRPVSGRCRSWALPGSRP
jgi:hypothetical protein